MTFDDHLRPVYAARVRANPEVVVTSFARCQSKGWRIPHQYAYAVDFGKSDYFANRRCRGSSRLLVRCVSGIANEKVRKDMSRGGPPP
jgi:hypothetical protein